MVEIGRFNSRRQEAMWWMPSDDTQVQVILANTTNEPLSVSAVLAGKPSIDETVQIIELLPNETRVLDLRQDFTQGEQVANSNLIALSLQHSSSSNGALLARVWVGEESRGYSTIVRFSNPDTAKSSEYHGAGFQIEDIDGIRFKPVIAARNVGNEDARVRIRVPYTRSNGVPDSVSLPVETIRPGKMVRFDTQKILDRAIQHDIKVAGLEITYDTAPGSIIASAQSVSNDRNHVFRVLLNDPLALPNASGGYPWRIDGTSTTQVYIKNVADYEQDYVAFLVWENGGKYTIGIQPIAAHETINIDIKKLRDGQIQDEAGRTIPISVSSGQLHWSIRRKDDKPADDALAIRSLIGRSQQVDIAKGIVTDYVCISCCAYSYMGAFVRPFPDLAPPSSNEDTIAVGQTITYTGVEKQTTCNGNSQGEPQFVYVTADSWSSTNTSVATVSSGQVTAVGPGTATILATWQARSWYAMAGSCRSSAPYSVTGSRTINVTPSVTINVPPSAVDGAFVNFSVSVSGATPTGYSWSFEAPSGAGNNPQVNFATPAQSTTSAKAHWFALPNSPCATAPPLLSSTHPYFNSKYKIKATVSYSGGEVTKEADFTVNAYWNPAGSVSPATNSGGPLTGFDNSRNLYVVVNSGTFARHTNAAVVNVPNTSQFYNKILRHEEKHELQWQSGLFQNVRSVSGFMAVIANFTDTTAAGLSQQITQAFLTWDAQQAQNYASNLSAAEIEAHAISDLLVPLYAYQRCGRTTWP